jgi:acyl-CoA synthetase (NDP forming)
MYFDSPEAVKLPWNMERVEVLFENAFKRGDGILFEHEVYEVFKSIGLDVPQHFFLKSGDDAKSISDKMTPEARYVAKVVLSGVTHKTETGGITFGVSAQNVAMIVRKMTEKFSDKAGFEGVLFASEIEYEKGFGSEIIIGIYQDDFFGPTVAFGLGGTNTEYLKDVIKDGMAQRFIPAAVSVDTAMESILELPAAKIILGRVRGASPWVSEETIEGLVEAFRLLGLCYSRHNPNSKFVIEEMETNPAVASQGRFVALDGMLKVSKKDYGPDKSRAVEKITSLLNPGSIAIAGASAKNPANPSNAILRKFLKAGHTGESIYLIHPSESEMSGIKCHLNIDAVLSARDGKPVDCLIVGVPAKIAGAVILESMKKGFANSIQIISAGFGETKAGRELEAGLAKKLHELPKNIRPVINGPNTLGNIYYNAKTLFTPGYKSSFTGKGKENAALICQSGAYMITRVSDLANVVAPPVAISVGNQMDLSVADFLEFLIDDKRLSTYGLYIEGLSPGDGLRLMKLSAKARELGKFIVIYKVGRTEAGAKAAQGHTASMAGDYMMFAELMKRSGAIVVDSSVEFNEIMMLTSLSGGLHETARRRKGKAGIAALSNAGYEKCLISEHLMMLHEDKFEFAKYSRQTQEKLQEIFAKMGIATLLDQSEVLDLSPMTNDEGYEAIIRATLADESTDFGIYAIVPETGMLNTCEVGEGHKEDSSRQESVLSRLIKIRSDLKKPFCCSMESGWKYDGFAQKLVDAGIPTFRSADAAARAAAKCLNAVF